MNTLRLRVDIMRGSARSTIVALVLIGGSHGLMPCAAAAPVSAAVAAPAAAMTAIAAVAVTVVAATATAATPAATGWQNDVPNARRLGQGKMTWFGMRLYDAALWSAAPAFDPKVPFALVLTYARDIERARLVSSTVEELKRQGADQASLDTWTPYLERAFVDVREGDTMTGVSLPGRGVRFYVNGRLTASIDDPRFAERFFAIWLARDTREPDLRRSLLGSAP